MRSSRFPDVNVWLALTYDGHAHHTAAAQWLDRTDESIFFCRFTQLGLLRLLTNEQVMGADLLNQRKAWQAYRRWFADARVDFLEEPDSTVLDAALEELSTRGRASTKSGRTRISAPSRASRGSR